MKSYEVKKISVIFSHFHNLEKLKKKTQLFLMYRKQYFFKLYRLSRFEVVFFEKFAVFIASMGKFFASD